jgi:hypothetical protein
VARKTKSNVAPIEYVIGFFSFIPFLGVIFGMVAIVLGSLKPKTGGWKLMSLGVSGILCTALLSFLIHQYLFDETSERLKGLQQQMAQGYMRQVVSMLEFYKQVHGTYPDKLDDLDGPKRLFTGHYLLTDKSLGSKSRDLYFYQKLPNGGGYYLLGRGPDGLPFTADDVFPDLSSEEQDHTGFHKKL